MDEAQREYLDAINKIAEEHKPKMLPISDEVVWLECFKAITMSPKSHGGYGVEEIADAGLVEFKKRFRKDE